MNLGQRFHEFIRNTLQPNKNEKDVIISKVESIRKILINNIGLQVSQTLYGGSFSKNTMLKNNNEADVVFVLSPKFPEDEFEKLLEKLIGYFEILIPGSNPTEQYKSVNINYEEIEIDILPVLAVKPPKELAKLSEVERRKFEAGTTRYHVDFVKTRGKKYQDFVKICKYWIKQNEKKICSSFIIELMCANIYDKYQEEKFANLFEKLLEWIVSTQLKVQVKFNSNNAYKSLENLNEQICKIIDPGNPSNNVADSIKDVEEFIQYAEESLNKVKKEKWTDIFGSSFPDAKGRWEKDSQVKERKSQLPPDSNNRRFGL